MKQHYACAYVTDNGDLYTELPKNEKALKKWMKEMEELNYKAIVFKIESKGPIRIDWDDYT